jgi:hypothetical protein
MYRSIPRHPRQSKLRKLGSAIAAALSLTLLAAPSAHAVEFSESFDGAFPTSSWISDGSLALGTDQFIKLDANQTLQFTFALASASLVDFSFWYGAYRPGQANPALRIDLDDIFTDSFNRSADGTRQLPSFNILNPGSDSNHEFNASFALASPIELAAGQHTLTFTALDYPSGKTYARIDDFYLSAAAVPEPDTWAMVFAGLGVVGFLGKRRRRQFDLR